jgi:hypothetical protein
MRTLQEQYKGKPAREVKHAPVTLATTIEGKLIATKLVCGKTHADTGFHQYADIDRESIEPLRTAGHLEGDEWRISSDKGNDYVISIKRLRNINALKFVYGLGVGRTLGRHETVYPANGNISDMRMSNLRLGRRPRSAQPLHWEKTPLDDATLAEVNAAIAEFKQQKRKRHHVKEMPIIRGHLQDGTPIAIKFVCGLRNEDTGKMRFVILDRDRALLVEGSELDGLAWGASRRKGREQVTISHVISKSVARIIFELRNPGTRIPSDHGVATNDGNPLNLCLDNLTLRRSGYKGTRN